MLIFADEGGRGVSGNADVSISFFEKKVFFCIVETKEYRKILKNLKII